MKHKLILLAGIVSALALQSCTTVINLAVCEENYATRMSSNLENEIASQTPIYYSEAEIPDTFRVISVNEWHPLIKIPIFYTEVKQQHQKMFKKAVMETYRNSGNAVLITGIGEFKSLYVGREGSSVSQFEDMKNANKFTEGYVDMLGDAERNEYMKLFADEIKSNTNAITQLPQLRLVQQKLDILDTYYNNLTQKDKKIGATIASLKEKLKIRERELLRTDIRSTELSDKFADGTVRKAGEKERLAYEKEFVKEIEKNISSAKEVELLEFAKTKIAVLENYCNSLEVKDNSLSGRVAKLREKDADKEYKLLKSNFNTKAKGLSKTQKTKEDDLAGFINSNSISSRLTNGVAAWGSKSCQSDYAELALEEIKMNLKLSKNTSHIDRIVSKIDVLESYLNSNNIKGRATINAKLSMTKKLVNSKRKKFLKKEMKG